MDFWRIHRGIIKAVQLWPIEYSHLNKRRDGNAEFNWFIYMISRVFTQKSTWKLCNVQAHETFSKNLQKLVQHKSTSDWN